MFKLKVDEPVEVDISVIVKALSDSNSDVQARFFNEFFVKLRRGCGDAFRYEQQLNFILIDLSKKSKEAMRLMGDNENV